MVHSRIFGTKADVVTLRLSSMNLGHFHLAHMSASFLSLMQVWFETSIPWEAEVQAGPQNHGSYSSFSGPGGRFHMLAPRFKAVRWSVRRAVVL